MELSDAITKYPWLQELLHELPQTMLDSIKIQSYAPHDTIMEHCEKHYYSYIILEGVCSSSQTTQNGTQFTLRKATVGDVIGFMNVYPEAMDFEASISARTKVVAALLPKPLMQSCFGTYHDFSVNMSKRVINRLQSLITLVSECNNSPSYIGLAIYLEYNYQFYLKSYPEHFDGPVKIRESRQNISDFLGINVRSIQRFLAKMKEEQLISITSHSIYINKLQYEALQKIHINWFPE